MSLHVTQSKNGVPVRLTDERWLHITEEHSELAGCYYEVLECIADPRAIYQGEFDALLAVREIEPGKDLVVVYREVSANDGFVITAFVTRKNRQLERRAKLWPR